MSVIRKLVYNWRLGGTQRLAVCLVVGLVTYALFNVVVLVVLLGSGV